jgi:hypothetical protein
MDLDDGPDSMFDGRPRRMLFNATRVTPHKAGGGTSSRLSPRPPAVPRRAEGEGAPPQRAVYAVHKVRKRDVKRSAHHRV